MVTWDDFDKIWASTSPLTPYEFSAPNYSQGWNFVGSTPPARQMWDSIQKKNDEKFKYLRDNFGTPNIVTQASQMTDTEKVYVYIGSEAGWNSGHWYYYDEGTSSWEDGGVYNSVAFVTDTTLSIAGQPADAKATGDALALKADLAGCTFTGNVNVSADLSVTGTSTLAGDIIASSDLSVAGDSALTNLSVSGTTALAGTSTAPTPSADDNSTKIATTEYVQTEIKPIETDVTINDKRISNIEKLLQGNLYDYDTDSSSAYTKTVPSGAMPYAGLEKVGGKTVVWNQLVDSGITTVSTISGHKYYTLIDGTASIVTADGTAITIVDDTADMVCDLTLMFGSGNEPSTTADFTEIYPATHYSYNAGTLLSAGVTEVDFTNNLFNKDDFFPRIPSCTLVDGAYRFWANNGYATYTPTYSTNPSETYTGSVLTVSFDVKTDDATYIGKKIYTGFRTPNNTTAYKFDVLLTTSFVHYSATVQNAEDYKVYISYENNSPVLIKNFQITRTATEIPYEDTPTTIYTIPTAIRNLEGYGWSCPDHYNYIDYEAKKYVQEVGSRAYASGDESDSTVITDGNTTYYPLNPAIETDISEYLTDDNLINVESGGTLTFPNSNGTDYQIPVPSEETYMIDLQEAINNG